MKNTYIIGHQKPDLDSVVASISFAHYCKVNNVPNPIAAIIDDPNTETSFVFNKFNQQLPNKITVDDIGKENNIVLVDHNEADQRLTGLNPDQIVAIFDHHKMNINFSTPISVCVLPYGSSNTVAWELFKKSNIEIEPGLASLMLCAILSDTVGQKSSTTTEIDKLAVSDLAQKAGITNIDELTLEIFKAKSNISNLTDEQVVLNDYKIFDFSGKKVLIGQTETVEQDSLISERKTNLLTALETIKNKEGVDLIFLTITDILKVNSKLILIGNDEIEIAEMAFGGNTESNVLDIGPKMSRKKDIAPLIEKALISN